MRPPREEGPRLVLAAWEPEQRVYPHGQPAHVIRLGRKAWECLTSRGGEEPAQDEGHGAEGYLERVEPLLPDDASGGRVEVNLGPDGTCGARRDDLDLVRRIEAIAKKLPAGCALPCETIVARSYP